MHTLTTRRAGLSDLDLIAALFDAYRQFYEQAANLALARQFIQARLQQSESVILLAFDGSELACGFCQLYPSFCSVEAKPIYTLYDLFVRPGARRSGAGRALLLAAHAQAASVGVARMDLSTAKTNAAAQALYESLGWVKDEVFLAYSKRVGV
jgi:ribosomal protein S18 acetylase RimI-like enzyme